MLPLIRPYPHGIQSESGVFRRPSFQLTEHLPGVNRQLFIMTDLRISDGHTQHGDRVGIGVEIQIIADVHRRNQKAQFLRQFLPHTFYTCKQFAAL